MQRLLKEERERARGGLSSRAENCWKIVSRCGKKEPTLFDLAGLRNCGRKTLKELIEWRLRFWGVKLP
jgi:hypothetical protein